MPQQGQVHRHYRGTRHVRAEVAVHPEPVERAPRGLAAEEVLGDGRGGAKGDSEELEAALEAERPQHATAPRTGGKPPRTVAGRRHTPLGRDVRRRPSALRRRPNLAQGTPPCARGLDVERHSRRPPEDVPSQPQGAPARARSAQGPTVGRSARRPPPDTPPKRCRDGIPEGSGSPSGSPHRAPPALRERGRSVPARPARWPPKGRWVRFRSRLRRIPSCLIYITLLINHD